MSRALGRTQLSNIIKTFTKHFPESYADKSWDNTGLLIDCSIEDNVANSVTDPKVLLTVDLTSSVAQEAIDHQCNLIIAYHPFIFPSWKSLTPQRNPQHGSAIRLIQNGISVYSPHTAMDAAKGGINDWLALGLVNNKVEVVNSIECIEKVKSAPNDDTIGYGRLVTFKNPISLGTLIFNIKGSLNIDHLQVATKHADITQHMIKSVALCAGSGSGVFREVNIDNVDLFFTGELSHHEILKYKEMNKAVIVCNHTNTERGFLRNELQERLTSENIHCIVSDTDVDPLRVV